MARRVSTREVALYFGFQGAVVRPNIFFQAHSQKSSRICDQLVVNFEPCYAILRYTRNIRNIIFTGIITISFVIIILSFAFEFVYNQSIIDWINFKTDNIQLYQSRNSRDNEHITKKNSIHTLKLALFLMACENKDNENNN